MNYLTIIVGIIFIIVIGIGLFYYLNQQNHTSTYPPSQTGNTQGSVTTKTTNTNSQTPLFPSVSGGGATPPSPPS